MSLLDKLKSNENDDDIKQEIDTLGGGGPLESDIYPVKVEMAYLMPSQKGALGVVLHLKTEKGQEIRQTVYITSGDAKGNKKFYLRDGEKMPLPGYTAINSLALLTVGEKIDDVETEQKVVNVYSFEASKEVPTTVEALTPLIGEEIYVGLQKQIVDKNEKADDGSYVPTGETREVNEIDKFFRASDKMTVPEILAEAETAEFFDKWLAKFQGKTRDRTSKEGKTSGGAAGTATKAGAPGAGNKPKKSLFGGK